MNQILKSIHMRLTALASVCFLGLGAQGYAQQPVTMEDLAELNRQLMQEIADLRGQVTTLERRVGEAEHVALGIPAEEAPETGVVRTVGGDIQLSGHVDVGFNWNTSGEAAAGGGNALRSLDSNANTFELHNAQLNIERPAPDKGGVGFKTVFMYGTDSIVSDSLGFDTADEFAIQQAYVEGKIPVGNGITVHAGKLATLQGAEVLENHRNWNSSRSFLFGLAIPFTHTGVRAMYDWFDGKVNTAVGLVNGWDSAIDNNDIKDIESRIAWQVADNFSISSGFMIGSQTFQDKGSPRGLVDVVASWVPLPESLPNLELMANFDYGWEEDIAAALEGGTADWQGYALYARYLVNEWLTLAARWEQMWDDQGVRTGGPGNDLWEMTYTADFKIYEDLLARLEYRHDHADGHIFDGMTRDTQNTIGANLIYIFE